MSSTHDGCELCASDGGTQVLRNALLRVVLVDDANHPGFCRVIVNSHVREMTDLEPGQIARVMGAVFAVEDALRAVLAPLLVVALAVPLVVVAVLLLVGLSMMPAVVTLVQRRRFPQLEQRRGASALQSAGWSLACTLGALLALAASLPLWFIPPLALVLPPLIWGWLAYRVLAFDALAAHASPEERRVVMRTRRWPLLAMGLACGLLGALPSLLWAAGAVALVFAPVLLAASVWLYTVVFAFGACWFAHYCLNALGQLRLAPPPAASGPRIEPTP